MIEKGGREAGGKTYFEFAIPFDSRDPADKPLVAGRSYPVLVAYHQTKEDFGALHSERGSLTLTLGPVLQGRACRRRKEAAWGRHGNGLSLWVPFWFAS